MRKGSNDRSPPCDPKLTQAPTGFPSSFNHHGRSAPNREGEPSQRVATHAVTIVSYPRAGCPSKRVVRPADLTSGWVRAEVGAERAPGPTQARFHAAGLLRGGSVARPV